MFENRLQNYFSPTALGTLLTSDMAPPQDRELPLPFVSLTDIYQAAYERARRDYEINRLFNPDYYEGGSGI